MDFYSLKLSLFPVEQDGKFPITIETFLVLNAAQEEFRRVARILAENSDEVFESAPFTRTGRVTLPLGDLSVLAAAPAGTYNFLLNIET